VALWVAEVAPVSLAAKRPDRSGHAAQVLPEADEIAQHLSGEDRRALQHGVVLARAGLHRAGEDRSTQRSGRATGEGGVDAPDRLEHVGVRGADPREAQLLCQPLHSRTREGAEDRGVEGLQGVGAAGGVTIVRYGPQGPRLDAEGVREERVGWDGDPSLLVDLGDGAAEGPERADPLLKEEAEHVPLKGGDLLANDHLNAQLVFDRIACAALAASMRS